MTLEEKRKMVRILSLVVIFAGIMVMTGWIFDIGILKSISPAWVTMKFDTAVAFVLSGITLSFILRALEGEFEKAQVALSITSLIIILPMGILFFSALIGIRTGVEDLFIKEMPAGVKTVTPGRPSLPTMLNFILIAAAGIMTTLSPRRLRSKLKTVGLVVGATGALATAGYIFNTPLLYYYVVGTNSAMACNTALLFVILGIGFVCLSD